MNAYMIPDINERTQALNPAKSFIVQAPAGSGKTELLTQRFLALLNCVKQPEEILAITFTKKSAAEMRARIINALQRAHNEPEPSAAHAKTTWKLAQNVLMRNQALQWNLLANPNRLRIQTMDSFNSYLTKQLPILSHFGATPDITDDPVALYREAVQEFLSHLEENVIWSDAIAQLLIHMDNDLNKVETLLINMLAKRDQWLPYITLNSSEPELRQKLENHLAAVCNEILTRLVNTFPKQHAAELIALADFAGHQLLAEHSTSNITHCANIHTSSLKIRLTCINVNSPALVDTQLNDIKINAHASHNQLTDIHIWRGIAELLLNKENNWRKRFDKSLGFPAPTQAINATEKKSLTDIKQRMTTLVEELTEYESFRLALIDFNLAPAIHYQDCQWKTLEALHQALTVVVAQLKLVFQKHSQIDYIENAQAALTALGTDDMPTDMTLALDYQLQHILIDEFQDTSHSQFKLIEKLTCGWENDDGRTLFVVGDPMQSIYRFREAEVGLFIQVRNHGLGHIKLEPLTLSVNFRSTTGIVNWINQHFKKVLPSFEDIATGAVSYNPSIANQQHSDAEALAEKSPQIVKLNTFSKSNCEKIFSEPARAHITLGVTSLMGIADSDASHADKLHSCSTSNNTDLTNAVALHACSDTDLTNAVALHACSDNETEQATSIVSLIQQLKKNKPQESIAILVRSRSHLQTVIPALKKANLAFRAIDIDPLNSRPVIQDLLALTRALLHPADRIAWLSILRAPWCGLTLSDLLLLSKQHSNTSMYEQLQSASVVASLSPDGQQRLARIFPIIQQKVTDRYRHSTHSWVESTWLLIGGPACVTQASDLEDAAAFFSLLDTMDQSGNQLNMDTLTTKVSQLYASPNNLADNSLQIMTIHNAKGLEFDTVILPHLERRSPNEEKQLLLWMERPLQNTEHALLIAPVHAVGHETDSIYEYIKRQHTIKTDYEQGRLLYVAATRAKKQLHLFYSLQKNDSNEIIKPATSSLLGKLWPAIATVVVTNTATNITAANVQAMKSTDLINTTHLTDLINTTHLTDLINTTHLTDPINTTHTINSVNPSETSNPTMPRSITRLAITWKNPIKEHQTEIKYHNQSSGFQLYDTSPKLIGTVIHQILQQISRLGITWWTIKPETIKKSYLKNNLLQLGILPDRLTDAIDSVILAIDNTLSDPRGQWIIQPHDDARSEFQLTAFINGNIHSLVIDRTFIDENNLRWIIDYKTTRMTDTDLTDFLHAEQKKYSQQMLHYAEAISKIDSRAIRFGLYFPLAKAWCEWEYT